MTIGANRSLQFGILEFGAQYLAVGHDRFPQVGPGKISVAHISSKQVGTYQAGSRKIASKFGKEKICALQVALGKIGTIDFSVTELASFCIDFDKSGYVQDIIAQVGI